MLSMPLLVICGWLIGRNLSLSRVCTTKVQCLAKSKVKVLVHVSHAALCSGWSLRKSLACLQAICAPAAGAASHALARAPSRLAVLRVFHCPAARLANIPGPTETPVT